MLFVPGGIHQKAGSLESALPVLFHAGSLIEKGQGADEVAGDLVRNCSVFLEIGAVIPRDAPVAILYARAQEPSAGSLDEWRYFRQNRYFTSRRKADRAA